MGEFSIEKRRKKNVRIEEKKTMKCLVMSSRLTLCKNIFSLAAVRLGHKSLITMYCKCIMVFRLIGLGSRDRESLRDHGYRGHYNVFTSS